MTIFVIDGTKLRLMPEDLDGDGTAGGIERVRTRQDRGLIPVTTPTETGEVIKESFKDDLDPDTGLSSIDSRSNIGEAQAGAIAAWNFLCRDGTMSREDMFLTRSYLRTAVSVNARGRDDIVKVASGQREMQAQRRLGMQGFFGPPQQ